MTPRVARGLLQLALASVTLLGCQDPNAMAQNLRSQAQQQLPIGSDKEHVIAFLRSHNIAEFSYSEKSRTLYAIVRDVTKPSIDFVRSDIQLRFLFDKDEKFSSYVIEPVYTGF